jgi:methylase of polypeptide subunit release factors
MAFVWWDDGLDLYRKMFNQLFNFKSEWRIWSVMMFLEMMTRQVEILQKEFWDKLAFEEVKTFHFNIRIVKASFKY